MRSESLKSIVDPFIKSQAKPEAVSTLRDAIFKKVMWTEDGKMRMRRLWDNISQDISYELDGITNKFQEAVGSMIRSLKKDRFVTTISDKNDLKLAV